MYGKKRTIVVITRLSDSSPTWVAALATDYSPLLVARLVASLYAPTIAYFMTRDAFPGEPSAPPAASSPRVSLWSFWAAPSCQPGSSTTTASRRPVVRRGFHPRLPGNIRRRRRDHQPAGVHRHGPGRHGRPRHAVLPRQRLHQRPLARRSSLRHRSPARTPRSQGHPAHRHRRLRPSGLTPCRLDPHKDRPGPWRLSARE